MRLTRSAAFAIALAAFVSAGQPRAQDGAAQAPSKDQAGTEAGDTGMPWGMGYGMMGSGMMGSGGPGFGMGMMRGHRHRGSMCAAMNSDIEGRLAYLKAELKITQQQEALWTAFAAAERDGAKAMTDHCKTMFEKRAATGLSLPDRLDRHEQMMAAALETARNLGKALKPLYATFSDSQKETADDLFWGPFGMM